MLGLVVMRAFYPTARTKVAKCQSYSAELAWLTRIQKGVRMTAPSNFQTNCSRGCEATDFPQLRCLAAGSNGDRLGSCWTPRPGANHLHFLPVVRKFLATIQADDIGAGDRGRWAAPKICFHCDGKAATLVRTTEDEIEQVHKPPLAASKQNRQSRPVATRSRVKPPTSANPPPNV